jgi:hypothetical protein
MTLMPSFAGKKTAPRAQWSVGTDHGNFRAVRGFKSTRFTSSMSKCQAKMPRYSFHIENGFAEDHALELANDSAAIDEGLKAASGMLRDLNLGRVGTQSQSFEIRVNGGEQVLRIEIHATRSR